MHDDEVMAQIADEAARNPEMSQQIFTAQDVEYENGAAFYMYCLAAVLLLGAWIIATLKSAACGAVKFSGAVEDKFRARQKY